VHPRLSSYHKRREKCTVSEHIYEVSDQSINLVGVQFFVDGSITWLCKKGTEVMCEKFSCTRGYQFPIC
jgi:hypothetical protein